ncbi:hypothetical protein [Pilimelia columellifera]|uniref:Alkaline shock response membrane anchor protein AmaP n=1 Tax=Pilimelia columellifera subsp. columellifera TaxID=706583 RepID=A0ABN3NS15_9ACTN
MRVTNRLAAMVLGLALAVAGLVAAVEALLVASGGPTLLVPRDDWHAALTSTRIGDGIVLGVAVTVGLAGLLILVAQVRPWPPENVDTAMADWRLRRSGVQRRVAAAVDRVPGVSQCRVRVRGPERRSRLKVRASGDRASRPAVLAATRAELGRLAVTMPDERVAVRLNRARRVT